MVRSSGIIRRESQSDFSTMSASPVPLFRQEVVQAKQVQWLGGIRIGRNPRFALVAWLSVAMAAALLAFATWGEITRKTRVTGLLESALGTLQLSGGGGSS